MVKSLKGLGVALVTPFTPDGQVDCASLAGIVDYVSANGADYLVVLGTTGESPTLYPQEKRLVLDTVMAANTRSLPIVLGLGGNSTTKVIDEIGQTDLKGVDAILSVVPFYNKPSQRGLFLHYKAIADNCPVGVILYNVPGRTGVNMLPETSLEIADACPNVVGVKEASGRIEQIEFLVKNRKRDSFLVISGDDALAVQTLRSGGDGLISVAANAFPAYYSRMMAAEARGEHDTADSMSFQVSAITTMLFREGNPPGIKSALSILGKCGSTLRLPLAPVSAELESLMRDEIRQGGFV